MPRKTMPSESSEDVLRALFAFYRLSRNLRNADVTPDLSWERLSTLGEVTLLEPVSISQLSREENVGVSAMSRIVATLEQQGCVRCITNNEDRRSVLVLTTSKGRATLQKGLVRTLERLAVLLSKLEDAELDAMAKVIRQARDGNRGN